MNEARCLAPVGEHFAPNKRCLATILRQSLRNSNQAGLNGLPERLNDNNRPTAQHQSLKHGFIKRLRYGKMYRWQSTFYT
jgi:hypothetical protein